MKDTKKEDLDRLNKLIELGYIDDNEFQEYEALIKFEESIKWKT